MACAGPRDGLKWPLAVTMRQRASARRCRDQARMGRRRTGARRDQPRAGPARARLARAQSRAPHPAWRRLERCPARRAAPLSYFREGSTLRWARPPLRERARDDRENFRAGMTRAVTLDARADGEAERWADDGALSEFAQHDMRVVIASLLGSAGRARVVVEGEAGAWSSRSSAARRAWLRCITPTTPSNASRCGAVRRGCPRAPVRLVYETVRASLAGQRRWGSSAPGGHGRCLAWAHSGPA